MEANTSFEVPFEVSNTFMAMVTFPSADLTLVGSIIHKRDHSMVNLTSGSIIRIHHLTGLWVPNFIISFITATNWAKIK